MSADSSSRSVGQACEKQEKIVDGVETVFTLARMQGDRALEGEDGVERPEKAKCCRTE